MRIIKLKTGHGSIDIATFMPVPPLCGRCGLRRQLEWATRLEDGTWTCGACETPQETAGWYKPGKKREEHNGARPT